MWADNGDNISRLYAGTDALKGDVTRTGRRTRQGALDDGINSAKRYYINNYRDRDRQIGIDTLLGYSDGTSVYTTRSVKSWRRPVIYSSSVSSCLTTGPQPPLGDSIRQVRSITPRRAPAMSSSAATVASTPAKPSQVSPVNPTRGVSSPRGRHTMTFSATATLGDKKAHDAAPSSDGSTSDGAWSLNELSARLEATLSASFDDLF